MRATAITGSHRKEGGTCTPCPPTPHLQSKRTHPAALRQNNSPSQSAGFLGAASSPPPRRTKASHPSQSHAPGPYFLLTAEVGGVGAMRELPPGSGCWSPLSEEVGSRNGNSPLSSLSLPPPPPARRSLPSSSSSSSSVYLKFEFYLRNISWNADIEKKKKKTTRSQPGSSSGGAMWHQATAKGKKVLLATQTWRNSSDMPISRSSPTFLLSPAAEHPGRQPQAPCGGRRGAPGECEGGRHQSPPGK